MVKIIILGLLVLAGCAGCKDDEPKSPKIVAPSMTLNVPMVGSDDWFVWVEKQVGTGDGAGHGPDYGSQEWCEVVEKKLLAGVSGIIPCTDKWNQKVTQVLLEKGQ